MLPAHLAVAVSQGPGGSRAHDPDDLQQWRQLSRSPPDAAVVGGSQPGGTWVEGMGRVVGVVGNEYPGKGWLRWVDSAVEEGP